MLFIDIVMKMQDANQLIKQLFSDSKTLSICHKDDTFVEAVLSLQVITFSLFQ